LSTLTPFQLQVANIIVATLNLEVAPEDIRPDAPLFYDGLGLDSIDALELALAFSQHYGVRMRSDDERNVDIFASLQNLATYIEENRDESA
jgi:acyl carrier protein